MNNLNKVVVDIKFNLKNLWKHKAKYISLHFNRVFSKKKY